MTAHATLAAAAALAAVLSAPPALAASPERPAPPPAPAAAAAAAVPEPAPPRTLHVSGEGRAAAAPDVALVSFGVTAVDPSLAKATRDATEAARRVQEALAQGGIAAADVHTTRYDIQIERRADKQGTTPRISGYRVSNEVRVKVRDLGKLGALLDRVVASGANEVRGLDFQKDDTSPERARALAAAVRDARARAEEIARAAGVRLGEVLQLEEGARAPGPGPYPMRAMVAGADVPVQPGQVEIVSRVDVVFAIQ